jgi:3-oxoacyl-[acyl-carrier protein] reductase
VADDIGPAAHTAVVDALDSDAVSRHLASVGAVDVSVNAVGIQNGAQGKPLVEMSADEFGAPIASRQAFVASSYEPSIR